MSDTETLLREVRIRRPEMLDRVTATLNTPGLVDEVREAAARYLLHGLNTDTFGTRKDA